MNDKKNIRVEFINNEFECINACFDLLTCNLDKLDFKDIDDNDLYLSEIFRLLNLLRLEFLARYCDLLSYFDNEDLEMLLHFKDKEDF